MTAWRSHGIADPEVHDLYQRDAEDQDRADTLDLDHTTPAATLASHAADQQSADRGLSEPDSDGTTLPPSRGPVAPDGQLPATLLAWCAQTRETILPLLAGETALQMDLWRVLYRAERMWTA